MPYVTTRIIQTFLLDDKIIMKQRMRGFRLPFGTRAVNKDGVKTEGGEDLSTEMTLKRKFGHNYQGLNAMDMSVMSQQQHATYRTGRSGVSSVLDNLNMQNVKSKTSLLQIQEAN